MRGYYGLIGAAARPPPGSPPLDPAFIEHRGGFWLRARQVALPIAAIAAAVWIGEKIVRAAERHQRTWR